MNLFAALVEEEFLAALLFLRDIFDIITYLNLVLQTSLESLCLSDDKIYIGNQRSLVR